MNYKILAIDFLGFLSYRSALIHNNTWRVEPLLPWNVKNVFN